MRGAEHRQVRLLSAGVAELATSAMSNRGMVRRATPVLAYVAALWLFRGWQFVAMSAVVGVAMMVGFTAWHRRSPESLDRFTYRLNSALGGPPGEAWRWQRRTRGLVLVVIGMLGIPGGLHVVSEPRDFVGGAAGGAVFTGLAAVALLLGLSLIGAGGDGRAESR